MASSQLLFQVNDTDDADLYPYFDEVADKIEENDKNELRTVVFCIGGVSRSPTIVIGCY